MDNVPNFAEMFDPQLLTDTFRLMQEELRATKARVKALEAKIKEMENAS